MWAVVPGEAAAAGGAEDVGVLVNHARLAVPLVPGVISSMDVQVWAWGLSRWCSHAPLPLSSRARARLRSSTFPAACALRPST